MELGRGLKVGTGDVIKAINAYLSLSDTRESKIVSSSSIRSSDLSKVNLNSKVS